MQTHRKRRLYFIICLTLGFGVASGLALYALRQNINLYFTPKQLSTHQFLNTQHFRLGGMVVKGSVKHGENLKVQFVLTDYQADCAVEYQGILPALFREGQGIVAEGHLNAAGVFIADQVLAKHDARYHPPGVSVSGNASLHDGGYKP